MILFKMSYKDSLLDIKNKFKPQKSKIFIAKNLNQIYVWMFE